MQTDTASLKAILWDMDGTLIDSEPMWMDSERILMAKFGYTWSKVDGDYCLGGPLTRVCRYMKEKSGSDLPEEWFSAELRKTMLAKIASGVKFMPGAFELLMEARDRGIEQALISASDRPIVDVVLQANPGIFSFAIAAGDLPRTKPDPLPYMEAAKRFGLQPKDCLVVEDSKVGVTSGLGSGALVLALAHFQEIPQSSNIFIRSSLEGVSLDELKLLHSAWRNDGALI